MKNKIEIANVEELFKLKWNTFQPFFQDLLAEKIDQSNVEHWLSDWSQLSEWCDELYNRLYVATSTNTADKVVEEQFQDYMQNFYPSWQAVEQKMKLKLIASGLNVPGFEIQIRNMKAEADLFREENLPLRVEEEKLNSEHDKIIGAQTLIWRGEERTVRQMEVVLRDNDRETRRQGWEAWHNANYRIGKLSISNGASIWTYA
jgi:oligoendopeptidase F